MNYTEQLRLMELSRTGGIIKIGHSNIDKIYHAGTIGVCFDSGCLFRQPLSEVPMDYVTVFISLPNNVMANEFKHIEKCKNKILGER